MKIHGGKCHFPLLNPSTISFFYSYVSWLFFSLSWKAWIFTDGKEGSFSGFVGELSLSGNIMPSSLRRVLLNLIHTQGLFGILLGGSQSSYLRRPCSKLQVDLAEFFIPAYNFQVMEGFRFFFLLWTGQVQWGSFFWSSQIFFFHARHVFPA